MKIIYKPGFFTPHLPILLRAFEHKTISIILLKENSFGPTCDAFKNDQFTIKQNGRV